MTRQNGFIAGVAFACGYLRRSNEYSCARELLGIVGIKSKEELRKAGVDLYDIDCIGDLLPNKEQPK